MSMTKVTVPPLVAGEVDTEMFRVYGRLVQKIGSTRDGSWLGYVLDISEGCLIFVPSVRSERVA